MTLFETSLYRFELVADQKVLKFTWTKETQHMAFVNFQESCMIYAGLAIEYNTSLLLIDTQQFMYTLPDDYMNWKNKDLNSRYAKVPVAKHAFLMPKAGFEAYENQEFKESTYLNRFFDNEQKALDWLLD